MKRRNMTLLSILTLVLIGCESGMHDCQVSGRANTNMLYAYEDADGNNHEGMVSLDGSGSASVSLPSSVDCGELVTRQIGMLLE